MYNINQEFSAIKLQFYLTAHSIDDLTRMYTYLYEGGDPRQVDYLYDTTLYFGGRIAGMEDFIPMVWSKIKNACRWVINLVIKVINRILSFIGVEPIKELEYEDYGNKLAVKKEALNKVVEAMKHNDSSALKNISTNKDDAIFAVNYISQKSNELDSSVAFLIQHENDIPAYKNATGLDAAVKMMSDGLKLVEIPDPKSLVFQILDMNETPAPFDSKKIKLIKLTNFTDFRNLCTCIKNECLSDIKDDINTISSKYDYLMGCANRVNEIERSLKNDDLDPDKAKQLGDDAKKEVANVTAEMTNINARMNRVSDCIKYLKELVHNLNLCAITAVGKVKKHANNSQQSGTAYSPNSSQQDTAI